MKILEAIEAGRVREAYGKKIARDDFRQGLVVRSQRRGEEQWIDDLLKAIDNPREIMPSQSYAGRMFLRWDDEVPAPMLDSGPEHIWATVVRLDEENIGCLLEWSTAALEAAWLAHKRQAGVVDRETFDAIRTAGIEERA